VRANIAKPKINILELNMIGLLELNMINAGTSQNGILKPKGSTRAEFAPFSHEPGLE